MCLPAVQSPSIPLSWWEPFHTAMPAAKAPQAGWALARHPCHHKCTASNETSACGKPVFAFKAEFWFRADKTLQQRSNSCQTNPSHASAWSVKVLIPPQSQTHELKPFSAKHCWTLSTVKDAQTLLGTQVETCPEQLAGTRGKLPHQFLRCGCLHKCYHWKVKQNNFTSC